MQLVKYDPFSELQRMERDLAKFWGSDWGLLPSPADTAPMDMYEEDGNLVAEIRLPNINKDEIKVTTDQGVLEVSAEHKEKEEEKDKRRYYFRESSNQYLRRVTLPEGAKTDKVEAIFKDGILKITMPVAETRQPAKKVVIK